MTHTQRLDNLSDFLTAKLVRSRVKKQLEVLVPVLKSTSSTGSTTCSRGRGRGGKSGSSACVPAGLCDVQELAAAYGDLGYTHPRSWVHLLRILESWFKHISLVCQSGAHIRSSEGLQHMPLLLATDPGLMVPKQSLADKPVPAAHSNSAQNPYPHVTNNAGGIIPQICSPQVPDPYSAQPPTSRPSVFVSHGSKLLT